jgi:PIN domain nuclease of toxin-antitoxin system
MQLSKITLGQPLRTTIEAEVSQGHFQILPLKLSHVFALKSLPMHHGDPFDRMLAAQTADEQMTFVTKDAAFLKYGIPLLW